MADGKQMVNVRGSPIGGRRTLRQSDIGVKVLGIDTLMHAVKAVEAVLIGMKKRKARTPRRRHGFRRIQKLVGYDKWMSVDEQFAPRL